MTTNPNTAAQTPTPAQLAELKSRAQNEQFRKLLTQLTPAQLDALKEALTALRDDKPERAQQIMRAQGYDPDKDPATTSANKKEGGAAE